MISPSQPWWRSFNRGHWFVFVIASLAWLFDCLDQQFFNLSRGPAMESILADKSKITEYASYTTSFFMAGWAIGGLILGALGDRFGRARMLTVTILIYSIFTGLSSFANSYFTFCACMFLTGMGIGGVFGLSVALVADSIPDATRAPAWACFNRYRLGEISSADCSEWVSGLLGTRHLLPFHLLPWQATFLLGAAPAFLCVFILKQLKEPQKWIEARDAGLKAGIKFGSYGELLKHPTWSKHAWAGLGMCSAGIVGLWGLGKFLPSNPQIDSRRTFCRGAFDARSPGR